MAAVCIAAVAALAFSVQAQAQEGTAAERAAGLDSTRAAQLVEVEPGALRVQTMPDGFVRAHPFLRDDYTFIAGTLLPAYRAALAEAETASTVDARLVEALRGEVAALETAIAARDREAAFRRIELDAALTRAGLVERGARRSSQRAFARGLAGGLFIGAVAAVLVEAWTP